MKITEWFCRTVAVGLIPEWPDIYAEMHTVTVDGLEQQQYCCVSKVKEDDNFCLPYNYIESFDGTIQLRQNNKDLYSLEWRKPTEQDVSKMCWFYDADSIGITLSTLAVCDFQRRQYDEDYFFLLADHGRLAPTEADFKRIYGE